MTHYGDKRFSLPRGDAVATADVKIKNMGLTTVTMASDDTQYSTDIPEGASDILVYLSNTAAAFRIAFEDGEVASGTSAPIAAGSVFSIKGPVNAFTLYLAHTAGSSQTAVVLYEEPVSVE